MNSHDTWKKKLFTLVKKHLPPMGINLGLLSDDPEQYKHEDVDEYRGAKMAMQLSDMAFTTSRYKTYSEHPNRYQTYLYAYGPIPDWKWNTDTRFLITTEGFYFRQEIPKMFGDNKLSAGFINYRDLEPSVIALKDNKLHIRVKSFMIFSDEVVEHDKTKQLYPFLIDAHKLYQKFPDLYDDAIDEIVGDDDDEE